MTQHVEAKRASEVSALQFTVNVLRDQGFDDVVEYLNNLIPELLADRDRLDWLQKQAHDGTDESIGNVIIDGSWRTIGVFVGNARTGEGPTLREAIDAARKL